MGNIFECPEIVGGARDQEQVVDTRTVALGLGIVGIEGFDAVDHVPKAEELRGEGANGGRPDTGVVFGHFDIAGGRPTAVESDLGCLGRREAEGDRVVGMDIGRGEFYKGCWAGLGECHGAGEESCGENC